MQHLHSGTYENGVSPQYPIDLLLKIWKAIHVSRGKVRSDEGWSLYSGDYFTAHHVCSMEAHGLNVILLWSLPHNQYYQSRKRESVDKDFRNDRVRVWTWFLLWKEQWIRAAQKSRNPLGPGCTYALLWGGFQ